MLIDKTKNTIDYRDSSYVPRIGDMIDADYSPRPVVSEVMWYPTPETIKDLSRFHDNSRHFDVIVFFG